MLRTWKTIVAASLLALTVSVAVPTTTASAEEYTPEQIRLFEYASANAWGPAEWESFISWARWMDVIGGVERCEPWAIDAYVGLLWGPEAAPRFQRIIRRESGMRCDAKNRSSSASGLTQQLDIHAHRYTRRNWDWSTARFRGVENLEIAYELYREQGFRPWALTA